MTAAPKDDDPIAPMIIQSLNDKTYALSADQTAKPKSALERVKSTITFMIMAPIFVPVLVTLSIGLLSPLRDRILSFWIPMMMNNVAKCFAKERKTLLEDVRGRVLDFGSGGGAYLDHCRHADAVVAMEPVVKMHAVIRDRAAANQIRDLTIVSSLQEILDDGKKSFDWIILGNVLCEVEDVSETLEQLNTLLKDGAMVYFSEHVACERGTKTRMVQNAVNPLWNHIVGGCNCNRDSLELILKVHGWEVISWTYHKITVVGGPFKVGLAYKK